MSQILIVRDLIDANGQKYTEQGHFVDSGDLASWLALGYRVDLGASIPKNQDRPAMQSDLLSLVRTVNGSAPDSSGNVTVTATGGGSTTSVNIADSSAVGRAVLTATDATAARGALGAGTSSLVIGTTSTTAKAGNWVPASTDLTDATTIGKALIVASSTAAARTAIGAGTSSLAIGTTATTAAAGNDSRLSDARTPLAHTHAVADVTGLTGQLAAKADLVGGKVPTSQLPLVALGETFPVASQAAMLAVAATPGDVALRSDTSPASAWMLLSSPATTLANWFNLSAAVSGAVTSINGQSGTVVLGKSDLGLGSVDNTADSAKPVSSAQSTAIGAKADKSTTISAGTGLSGGGDLSANRTLTVAYGTAAGTAAQGNDSRITGAAADSTVVHLAGAETIAGVKTFSAAPVVPTPTAVGNPTTKAYVDAKMYWDAEIHSRETTARTTGTMDAPLGITVPRALTLTNVFCRFGTADASGSTVVTLYKNGTSIATVTVAAAATTGTVTGSVALAQGDVLTVGITTLGTTPGIGLSTLFSGLFS